MRKLLIIVLLGAVGAALARWYQREVLREGDVELRIKLSPAGHILGSAYVECELRQGSERQRIVFSGDLGAPARPVLRDPQPIELDTCRPYLEAKVELIRPKVIAGSL